MTRIAGLPKTASQRAFDMFLKVRHVQSVNEGGGVNKLVHKIVNK